MLLEELFREGFGGVNVFKAVRSRGDSDISFAPVPITRSRGSKPDKKGGTTRNNPGQNQAKAAAADQWEVQSSAEPSKSKAAERVSIRVAAAAPKVVSGQASKTDKNSKQSKENAKRRRQEAERREADAERRRQEAERRKADAEERNRTSSDDSDDKKVKSQQNRKNKSSIAPVDKDKIKPSANDDNVDDKKQKSTQDKKAQNKKVADLEKKRQEKEEMLRRKEELARERAKQKGQSVAKTGTDDIAYDDSDDAKRKSSKDRTDVENKLRDKWEAGKGDDADDKKTKSQQSKKDNKVVDIKSKGSDKNPDASKENPIKSSDKPAANDPEANDKKVKSQQDGKTKGPKILPPATGIDPEKLHQDLGKEYQNTDYKARAKADQEFKDVGDKAYNDKLAELEKDKKYKLLDKTRKKTKALEAKKAAEQKLLKNKMNDAIDKATDLPNAERKALKGMAAKIAARHAAGMLTGPLAPFIQIGLVTWDAYEIATYIHYMYTHPEAWEAGKQDAWTRDTFGSSDGYMSP